MIQDRGVSPEITKNRSNNTKPARGCTLWITVIIGVISACAGPFRSRKPLPHISPNVLVHSVEDHAAQLKTFQGRADISIASAEGAFRGSMRISVKMPDSLWMKIEGPLGIDAVTGSFTGDHAVLYSPWEKTVYKGSFQQMREYGLLPLDMGFSDMVLSILGLMIPLSVDSDSLFILSSDHKKYVIK